MARSPAEELIAKAQLADNIIALVKATGFGGAKRGRKPGSRNKAQQASGKRGPGRPRKKKQEPAAETQAQQNGAEQAPIGEE